jgi:hypothetical protein
MIAAVHPIKRSAQGRSSTMLPRLVFGRGWFKLIDWQYRPTRSLRWSAFLWVLGGSWPTRKLYLSKQSLDSYRETRFGPAISQEVNERIIANALIGPFSPEF